MGVFWLNLTILDGGGLLFDGDAHAGHVFFELHYTNYIRAVLHYHKPDEVIISGRIPRRSAVGMNVSPERSGGDNPDGSPISGRVFLPLEEYPAA